jgi:hypothetical protein
MTPFERVALHMLAEGLEKNSVVVEVGAFLGGSAAVMANANKDIFIYSFDLFSGKLSRDQFHRKYQKERVDLALGENCPRTIENVADLNKQYTNIKFYQGISPDEFLDWNTAVDFYFEDGNHRMPYIQKNLEFWGGNLKVGGHLLCHDYRPWLEESDPYRCLDVETSVNDLTKKNFKIVGDFEGLILLEKVSV